MSQNTIGEHIADVIGDMENQKIREEGRSHMFHRFSSRRYGYSMGLRLDFVHAYKRCKKTTQCRLTASKC
jgi:hypothetical protein